MQSLDDTMPGRFAVATAAGASYWLDLDGRTVTRRLHGHENDSRMVLRQDEKPVALIAVVSCEVGYEMHLAINLQLPGIVATSRITTPVVRITRLTNEVAR